jgi:hypothetical protein
MIPDFPKENRRVRQVLINSDSLRNALVATDGKRGTKICRQVSLAERMGIEKDTSRTDERTRERSIRAVSDQNLVADVQNREFFM